MGSFGPSSSRENVRFVAMSFLLFLSVFPLFLLPVRVQPRRAGLRPTSRAFICLYDTPPPVKSQTFPDARRQFLSLNMVKMGDNRSNDLYRFVHVESVAESRAAATGQSFFHHRHREEAAERANVGLGLRRAALPLGLGLRLESFASGLALRPERSGVGLGLGSG